MSNMVSYFCQECAAFWQGAPIQISENNRFTDLCFNCMVKNLNRWRKEIRDERKREKKCCNNKNEKKV